MEIPILTVLLFTPLAFALGVWVFGGADAQKVRLIAFTGAACTLVLAFFGIYRQFDPELSGLQFEEKVPWIPSIRVFYPLGIDGLSMAMVLLVSVITLLVIFASWERSGSDLKNFYGLILLEEFGLLGAFT